MDMKNLSKTQKLCFSGAVMAIYIVLMPFRLKLSAKGTVFVSLQSV